MTRFLVTACLAASFAHAEDARNYHYIQVPSKDADGLRKLLSSDQMAAKPEAIAGLPKSAAEIASFKNITFESGAPFAGIKPNGVAGAAEQERALEVKLNLTPGTAKNAGLLSVSAFAEEPISKKAYQGYAASCSQLKLPEGKWLEVASWGRGNDTLMLWAYNPSEGAAPAAPSSLRLEARFCLAAPADIEQLKKATTETREKAVKWILGRSKTYRESTAPAAIGQKTSWEISDTKLDAKDGAVLVEQTAIHWDCKLAKQETGIESTWKISLSGGGSKEETVHSMTLNSTLQIWDYTPVDGGKEFNLMIFRISDL